MVPVKDADGVIVNAAMLRAEMLVHRKVLCPACGQKTFEMWPEGWDAHAAHRCEGLEGSDIVARKAEYKSRLRHLFR